MCEQIALKLLCVKGKDLCNMGRVECISEVVTSWHFVARDYTEIQVNDPRPTLPHQTVRTVLPYTAFRNLLEVFV